MLATSDRSASTQPQPQPHPGSFRDPAGFIFTRDGVLYRQVNPVGRPDYDALMSSGLYRHLMEAGDLVRHEEVDLAVSPDGKASVVIRPERVPFVSYPYEWCFSQLKDAALLTLRLQKEAVRHGMSLKDATAYNVAFDAGRPIWIDTLSFERQVPGKPWVAYRQFCQFFLAPLALISYVDVRLLDLLRSQIDGVPIDLASRLLPARSRLRPGILTHIHLHAATERRVAGRTPVGKGRTRAISATSLAALLDSLERTVAATTWNPAKTTWSDYYEGTNYTNEAFDHKRRIISEVIERLAPRTMWDLGANDGTFSRLGSEAGIPTVAFDVDPLAVEKNYRRVTARGEQNLLPLVLDLTNPSPRSGWAHEERDSFVDRGPADLVLALALVHHLAIAHNVPLPRIADFLSRIGRTLVIEFVPKSDSQLLRMLATRDDIFTDYSADRFEAAFSVPYVIEEAHPVSESERVVYVMRRRDS